MGNTALTPATQIKCACTETMPLNTIAVAHVPAVVSSEILVIVYPLMPFPPQRAMGVYGGDVVFPGKGSRWGPLPMSAAVLPMEA